MFNITESVIRLALYWGGLIFFLIFELLFPYRPSTVSKFKRWINNLVLSLFNSVVLNLIFSSMVISTALYVQNNNLGVLIFESVIVFCAQFHHSCLTVPKWFETIFWILFVPPSMHRIHHSVVIKERNTNYGTIFSLWDRFMGTLLKDVAQEKIRIGVGAYNKADKLNLHQLLWMPFTGKIR